MVNRTRNAGGFGFIDGVLARLRAFRARWVYSKWQKDGCPLPPPHSAKQKIIREYQKKFDLHVLVETGTFQGDTVAAQRKNFRRIVSIELDKRLYSRAVARFRGDAGVGIHNGDGGEVLSSILPALAEPCLFWLDGHYSGGITAKGLQDTSIKQELCAIFTSRFPHVILIDDARCFRGENGYPTIEELKEWVERETSYSVLVDCDIIRLTKQA